MKNNKSVTAVEWLFQKLWDEPKDKLTWYAILKQAKEMEEEQSLNFAKHCLDKAKDLDVRTAFLNVEQYYNETFKTKEK